MSEYLKKAEALTVNRHRFDYTRLDGKVANFLQGHADRLRRSISKSLIQIGRDLIMAKHYLSHGAFVRWVESEIGIPARTAQGYMKIAQWVEGKCAKVAHLPPSALYILSKQTTPSELVESVLTTIEAGGTISISEIRNQLRVLNSRQEYTQPFASSDQPTSDDALTNDKFDDASGAVPHYDVNADDNLFEVVEILVRALSTAECERIHQIMTDDSLLSASDLAQRIHTAFENIAYDKTSVRTRPRVVYHPVEVGAAPGF